MVVGRERWREDAALVHPIPPCWMQEAASHFNFRKKQTKRSRCPAWARDAEEQRWLQAAAQAAVQSWLASGQAGGQLATAALRGASGCAMRCTSTWPRSMQDSHPFIVVKIIRTQANNNRAYENEQKGLPEPLWLIILESHRSSPVPFFVNTLYHHWPPKMMTCW